MKLVHGDKLTRRLFIKKGKTGRRYEKLWKNWDKFIKAATAQLDCRWHRRAPGLLRRPRSKRVTPAR
jgi:hypothetical protein